MRDGRSTGLGWPPLVGSTQQLTERWCLRQGGSLIGDSAGEERVGRTFTLHFGRRFERRNKKIERARRRGLGFRWLLLDGGTQQPTKKSAEIMGYIFGRRRAGRRR